MDIAVREHGCDLHRFVSVALIWRQKADWSNFKREWKEEKKHKDNLFNLVFCREVLRNEVAAGRSVCQERVFI